MNCYDFSFQESYTGFWKFDGMEDDFSGTLFLHNNSIEIELISKNYFDFFKNRTRNLHGTAFAENSNGKEESYKFMLCGLHFKKEAQLNGGINRTILDVEKVLISQGGYDLNEITSVCIRTPLLDKWTCGLTKKGFKNKIHENGRFEMEFVPQQKLTLYNDINTSFNIYIHFGWHRSFKMNSNCIGTKDFLNIEFESKINLYEANKKNEIIRNFLCLLWNRTFTPVFTEFRSTKGNFILKFSKKHSYQYIENFENSSPDTEIEDFDENVESVQNNTAHTFSTQMIEKAISKWLELYDKHTDALDTYFDTIFNGHISPSVKIKNFISTIDALSENLKGTTRPVPNDSRNGQFLQNIFQKTEGILDQKEKKRLRDLVLKEKTTYLKPRFRKLIKSLENLVPEYLNDDFVEKVVNTRNNITHPKDKEDNTFHPEDYDKAAYLLTKVIRAYLLKELSIQPKTIKKIIEF